MPPRTRRQRARQPRPPRALQPLDPVRVRGRDALVLEIKDDGKAVVQLETGNKLTVPASECLRGVLGPAGGRPPKPDKDQFGQITCVLRYDTIEQLREGADSKHFGEFLQDHLDRYPPPSREEYLALTQKTPFYTTVKRRKVPTLIAAGSLSKKAKRLQRERARREKMTPEERVREDEFNARLRAVVTETYANNR